MAVDVNYGEAVYGLHELQIAPVVAGVVGAYVDLPGKTLSYSIVHDEDVQKANDQVVATIKLPAQVEWEMEAGLYPLAAIEIMYGGTLTVTGSGATEETEFVTNVDDDSNPCFAIRGRAIAGKGSDGGGGGDMHVLIPRAYTTGNREGSLQGENFFSPSFSGVGLPDAAGDMLKETQRATAAAFV